VVAAHAPLIGLRGFNPISASAMKFISTRQGDYKKTMPMILPIKM
jgi:hypothetical protein